MQLSQLRDTFQEIDTANEGYITLEVRGSSVSTVGRTSSATTPPPPQELRKVLTDYHIDDDEITKIFDGMDIDQTGKISYTEVRSRGACLSSRSNDSPWWWIVPCSHR